MKILVSNDDGINAEGLWALVKELKNIAEVVVVASDREHSGTGAAITLKKPLRVQEMEPMVPDVEVYSVDGTPADNVIVGLDKLVKDEVALVVSGINHGPNLGHDVLVSGTVGAALQGYLRGLPALAVSMFLHDKKLYLDDAAKLAALLAERICSKALPSNVFLNVNLPNLPLGKIKGIKVTRLVNEGHIATFEEGQGEQKYYCLEPQQVKKGKDRKSDAWAVAEGNISITPLHTYLNYEASPSITDSFCSDIFQALQKK